MLTCSNAATANIIPGLAVVVARRCDNGAAAEEAPQKQE